MKRFALVVAALLLGNGCGETFKLDYDRAIPLDAEQLAEGGVKAAYNSLLPELQRYVLNPVDVEERFDPDASLYTVTAADTEYVIYAPTIADSQERSWYRATWALFTIVNNQLSDSNRRFYAINDGNDLIGMFLTAAEVEKAKRSLKRKQDWPYLPTDEHPYYGQQR